LEQIVDPLEAQQDAEFLSKDPSDIEPAEDTDAVLGAGRVSQALLQPGILLGLQPRRPSAAGLLVERLDAPSVVLRDPVLDGAERAAQGRSDILGGAPLFGEGDGLDAAPESFLGDGSGRVVELFQGVMVGDEHG